MAKLGISILSMDYMELGNEIKAIGKAQADFIHLDVMDGYFVPNITFGPDMVRQIRKETDLFLDVHLMINSPEKYIAEFVEAGADKITFHYETNEYRIEELIKKINNCDVKTGIAIKPNTKVESIKPYLNLVDSVLQMTVEPGFGGQSFKSKTLKNIEKLSEWKKEKNADYLIEVDGGINLKSAKLCVESGVDSLIAGSSFIKATDKDEFVNRMQSLRVSTINETL